MRTDVEIGQAPPTEVLIPEARQRRRRRYVRTVLIVGLGALVIAALIAAAVILFGRAADGKSQGTSSSAAVSHATGVVYFRPVLCYVPPYNPAQKAPTSGSLSCDPANALTEHNLNIQPSGTSVDGFSSNMSLSDTALAGVPTTKPSADKPGATVLLPGIRAACDGAPKYRCLLGPSEMSSASIKSASAHKDESVGWVVDFTMTPRGSIRWDKVTQASFHQILGIELNGVVYSAPIIQPIQSSFGSFNGKGEVSGSLTKADAIRLAKAMEQHES